MYNLIRNFVFYAVILIGLAAGISILLYDTADPCRILAKQKSDDTMASVSEILGGGSSSTNQENPTLEGLFRALTVQYSTRDCAQELGTIWMDDLSTWWDELSG